MALFMTLAGAINLVIAIGAFGFMNSYMQLPFIAACAIGGLLLIAIGHLCQRLDESQDKLPRQ